MSKGLFYFVHIFLMTILLFTVAIVCFHSTKHRSNQKYIGTATLEKWRKNNENFIFSFDRIIILKFDKTKVAREEFNGAKKSIKIWEVNVDMIARLIKTKSNSKYFIVYSEDVMRSLVLIRYHP